MKLKIPRGTKPTITIDGIQALDISHRHHVRATLYGPPTPEELEAFEDVGITVTNDDELKIIPGLWTRVEVIQ